MSEEWRDGLPDAHTLVSAIKARNAVEPGYAKAILHALGAKLALADIRAWRRLRMSKSTA